MAQPQLPAIGLLWAQFAAYHGDRIEATARRLSGRYEVVAVEVATASLTYRWAPSDALRAGTKITLFPGALFEAVPRWRRWRAMWRALRRCQAIFVGISYAEPDVIALVWLARLTGRRVVVMADAKFDDRPRSVWREAGKALLLAGFHAALVAGPRQAAFFRMLGFGGRRPLLLGYDTVGVARVRAAAQAGGQAVAERDRAFLYVGRFVPKKNLLGLIDAYAIYAGAAGPAAHPLRLVGAGPLEAALRARVAALGLAPLVRFEGFLPEHAVPAAIAPALALILVSTEEQWGLVVNEAVALGVPVIATFPVGAADLLIAHGHTGFVIEPGRPASLAAALEALAGDPTRRDAMVRATGEQAWTADAERFAEAVEVLAEHDGQAAADARAGTARLAALAERTA